MPNLKLDKTLVIDDQIYDINAKTAEKLENALTINIAGKSAVTFDGAAAKNISVVSAEGGPFSGPVQVPSFGNFADAGNTDILNKSDTSALITALIATTGGLIKVHTWDGSTLTNFTRSSATQYLGLVIGESRHASAFFSSNSASSNKWLPIFIYLCTDNGNLYYGTSSDTSVQLKHQLARTANKAVKDNEEKDIHTNYYRSASNTSEVNSITVSSAAPSGGAVGDIWIKY
jgi:hypothetical protein